MDDTAVLRRAAAAGALRLPAARATADAGAQAAVFAVHTKPTGSRRRSASLPDPTRYERYTR